MSAATSIYKEIDGLRHHLEQRQNSGRADEFPKTRENYTEIFHQIESFLNDNVHPEVVTGAALQGDGLLNDHGKEHVDMVISRASLILGDRIKDLKGFEIFLLLMAIHFHDIGNIYGRDKHEERISEVMEQLSSKLPLDSPSKATIVKIAMSHGGMFNDSKDTISTLPEIDHLNGIEIRPALISSILRYADEISDDHTRSARFLFSINKVPPENKVFHDYSTCLQPAAVKGNTLILIFDIPLMKAINESSKKDTSAKCGWSSVFLYDEILIRLKKCLCELEYCRKYSHGFINVTSIQARINVLKPNTQCVYTDSIRLRLSGYPAILDNDLDKIWEEAPRAKNGSSMKEMLEKS